MSYKEQQEEEICAIESIYTENEVVSINKEYPNIELELELNSAGTGCDPTENDFPLGLHLKLPEKYPDEPPEIEIDDTDENFDEERMEQLKETLKTVANENLGMVMIFTIVSALQEEIGKLIEERKEIQEKKIEEEKVKKETIENRKFQGTTVTAETFKAWKAKFDAERKVLQDKAEQERQLALAGKLTGKEQFLRDATLNISDVALLDNANDVEIDESLFEEDIEGLEIEDDED